MDQKQCSKNNNDSGKGLYLCIIKKLLKWEERLTFTEYILGTGSSSMLLRILLILQIIGKSYPCHMTFTQWGKIMQGY